jgi:hypothetical protein
MNFFPVILTCEEIYSNKTTHKETTNKKKIKNQNHVSDSGIAEAHYG